MPIPLIVLCAVILFIVFLLSIRVRFVIRAKDGVTLDLKILFVRIRLYPRKKKINPRDYSPDKQERDKEKAAERAKKESKKADATDTRLTLRDKIALVRALCATVIRHTRKHLRLRASRLHIRVATGDAASTAIAYGAVSQSVSYLLAGLSQITDLKASPPDVNVFADFVSEHSSIDADITLSISVWGALLTAIPALLTYFNKKRALKNARKKQEQQDQQEQIASQKGN